MSALAIESVAEQAVRAPRTLRLVEAPARPDRKTRRAPAGRPAQAARPASLPVAAGQVGRAPRSAGCVAVAPVREPQLRLTARGAAVAAVLMIAVIALALGTVVAQFLAIPNS